MDMKPDKGPRDDEGWEYGDVWRQGSPDQLTPEDDIQYVEILRGDTGMGYDDSSMLDLVMYLGSRGVQATYDCFPSGFEGVGAIKSYVLKVEVGKEEEAKGLLSEKLKI